MRLRNWSTVTLRVKHSCIKLIGTNIWVSFSCWRFFSFGGNRQLESKVPLLVLLNHSIFLTRMENILPSGKWRTKVCVVIFLQHARHLSLAWMATCTIFTNLKRADFMIVSLPCDPEKRFCSNFKRYADSLKRRWTKWVFSRAAKDSFVPAGKGELPARRPSNNSVKI